MKKAGIIVCFIITLCAIQSCQKPFACFTTNLEPEEIRVGVPVTFSGVCSSNANDFFWEFYDNEDSTEYGFAVTKTFYQPGDVKVFLLVTGRNATSSTSSVITVLP